MFKSAVSKVHRERHRPEMQYTRYLFTFANYNFLQFVLKSEICISGMATPRRQNLPMHACHKNTSTCTYITKI